MYLLKEGITLSAYAKWCPAQKLQTQDTDVTADFVMYRTFVNIGEEKE